MTVIAKSSPGSSRFQGIAGHLVENYVGYAREIAFGLNADRKIKDLRVFDGVTPGGHIVWPTSASAITEAGGSNTTIYARNYTPINSPEHNIGDLWIHPITGHIFIYRDSYEDASSANGYLSGYWEDLGNFKGGGGKGSQDSSHQEGQSGKELDPEGRSPTLFIAHTPPPAFLDSYAEEGSTALLYDFWYDMISGGFWQLLALNPIYSVMADKSFYADLDTDRVEDLTCIQSVIGSGDGDFMPFAWIYLGKSKTPEVLASYAMPPRDPADTVVAGDYYFDEFSGKFYTYRIATKASDVEDYDAPASLPNYWSYSADLYHPTLFNDAGPPPVEEYTSFYHNTSYYDDVSRRIYRLEDYLNGVLEDQNSSGYGAIDSACGGVDPYTATFTKISYKWNEVGSIVASEAFFGSSQVSSFSVTANADTYYDSYHRYYSKVIEPSGIAYDTSGPQYVEPYHGEWQEQSAVVAGDFFTGTGSPSSSTRPYDIYYDEDERVFYKYEPDSYLSYSFNWEALDQVVAGDFFTGTGIPAFSTRPYDIYYDEDERVFYKYDSSSSSWTELDQIIATHFMFDSETTALLTPRPNDVKYVESDLSFYKYLSGAWELMATIPTGGGGASGPPANATAGSTYIDFGTNVMYTVYCDNNYPSCCYWYPEGAIGPRFIGDSGAPSATYDPKDIIYFEDTKEFHQEEFTGADSPATYSDSCSGALPVLGYSSSTFYRGTVYASEFIIGEGDPIVENPTTARQFDIYYDKDSSRIWKYDVTNGWEQETPLGGGGNKWVVIPATSIFTPASVWWGYEVNFFDTPTFDYATGSYVFQSGKTQSLIIRLILPDSYRESPDINIYSNLGMHYSSETTLEIISAHNFTTSPNITSNTLSVSSVPLPDGTGSAAKFDTVSGSTYSLDPGGTIATKLTCTNPSSDRKFTGLIVTWE